MHWCFGVLWLIIGVLAPRLNDYINDYEPLFYPYITLREKQKTEFYFRAFHQDFHVVLRLGSRTLAAQAKLIAFGINSTKVIPITDVSRHLVTGYVREFINSTVYGHVFDGIFVGVINTLQENYNLDRPSDILSSSVEFGSIIYRYSDINITAALCVSSENCRPFIIKTAPKLNFSMQQLLISGPYSTGKICSLRIMIDHVYYKETSSSSAMAKAIANIVSIIDQINEIYRSTDFDNDGSPDGVGFTIVEFVIWWNKNQPGYHHHAKKISAEKYITLLTKYKTNDVCLFFAFTARDFGPTLGVAFVRKIGNLGGICSPQNPINDKYYNVGFVTIGSRKRRLPNAVVVVLAAHEIGHTFGSEHDPITNECSPHANAGGKYIMYASAPNIHTPNSHSFSPCSIQEISSIISKLGTKCFVEENSFSHCGNGIVDSSTEECDCGDANSCIDFDLCCTPFECILRRDVGAQCSNREDACCDYGCIIANAAEKKHCNAKDECKNPSFCDGFSKDCPHTSDKPNGSACRKGVGICVKGKCVLKACHENNLEECQPFGIDDLCVVSCLKKGWCFGVHKIGISREDGPAIKLPDGEPCLGGTGKCKNGKCKISNLLGEPTDDSNYPSDTDNDEKKTRKFNYLFVIMTICFFLVICLTCVMCILLRLFQLYGTESESSGSGYEYEYGSYSESNIENTTNNEINLNIEN